MVNIFFFIDYEKKKLVLSFVDRIFGGELISIIMCDECRIVSRCSMDWIYLLILVEYSFLVVFFKNRNV